MRMILSGVLAIALAGVVCAPMRLVAQTGDKQAQRVASYEAFSWLGLLDAKEYAECWASAAASLKSALTAEKFASAMKAAREPLGRLKTRSVQSATSTTTLPGAPEGDYMVILIDSSFENKATAMETVIMSREKDKQWQVAGYFIK